MLYKGYKIEEFIFNFELLYPSESEKANIRFLEEKLSYIDDMFSYCDSNSLYNYDETIEETDEIERVKDIYAIHVKLEYKDYINKNYLKIACDKLKKDFKIFKVDLYLVDCDNVEEVFTIEELLDNIED